MTLSGDFDDSLKEKNAVKSGADFEVIIWRYFSFGVQSTKNKLNGSKLRYDVG